MFPDRRAANRYLVAWYAFCWSLIASALVLAWGAGLVALIPGAIAVCASGSIYRRARAIVMHDFNERPQAGGTVSVEIETWRVHNRLFLSERTFRDALEAAQVRPRIPIAIRRFTLVSVIASVTVSGVWGLLQPTP